jgi:hypothetical protein
LAKNWRKTDIWLKNGMLSNNSPKINQKSTNKQHPLIANIVSCQITVEELTVWKKMGSWLLANHKLPNIDLFSSAS